MFADLFAVIAPVFLCAAVGFLWAKTGRKFDTQSVSALVTNIGTPCLVVGTLSKVKLDPTTFGEMALATAVVLALTALTGFALLRLARLPAAAYLPSLLYGNSGNMALPLCLFAFGEVGLGLAIAFFTVAASTQFSIGAAIAAGTASATFLLRVPMIWATAVALVLLAFGITLPRWVDNTVQLLGNLTIPLMLMALGVSLAGLRVRSLRRSVLLSLARLVPGLLIGLGVAELFGFTGAARGVLVIQSAMPVAVFNYVFAERYDRAPAEVASMVVISTALSFATLPGLLLLVL